MNNMLYRGMLKATRLTRAGQLGQATALVQRVLRGQTAPDPGGGATVDSAGAPPGDPSGIINVTPDVIEARDHQRSSTAGQAFGTAPRSPGRGLTGASVRSYTPEALRSLLERIKRVGSGLGSGKPPPQTSCRKADGSLRAPTSSAHIQISIVSSTTRTGAPGRSSSMRPRARSASVPAARTTGQSVSRHPTVLWASAGKKRSSAARAPLFGAISVMPSVSWAGLKVFEYRYAENHPERLPELAAELVHLSTAQSQRAIARGLRSRSNTSSSRAQLSPQAAFSRKPMRKSLCMNATPAAVMTTRGSTSGERWNMRARQ